MPTNTKKTTVQDLAIIANVSVATVSRALSKPHLVSDKARLQVMEAVEKTGYTINEAARNLRRQQTDTIVILVPNIGNSVFSNVVEGIETICADNNLNVLVADTQKASMSPQNARSYFSQNRVDGVIIMDGLVPLDVISTKDHALPAVFAGEWNPASDLPVVRINDQLGVRMAIEHLHQLGHRHFGHLTGPLFHTPGQERFSGFKQALQKLSYPSDNAWIFEGDFTLKSGAQAARAWFSLPEERRPTGVFCASDAMAFGFISTLSKLGISVPNAVSVIGYDDLQVAEYYVPALTTIHQPRQLLGRIAAQTLLAQMKKEDVETSTLVDPWLVVRDSTARHDKSRA